MQEHEPSIAVNHTTLVAMPQTGEIYITADTSRNFYIRGPEGTRFDRPLTEEEVEEAVLKHGYIAYEIEFETPEELDNFRHEEAARFAVEHGFSGLLDTSEFDEVDAQRMIETAQRLSTIESSDFTRSLLSKILDFPIVQRTPELRAEVTRRINDISAD